MEIIRGEFLRFLKAPADGGRAFALVRAESSGQLTETKIGGLFSPLIKTGEWFVAEGEWRRGKEYKGKRELIFNSRAILPDLPVTEAGAVRILSSTFTVGRHGINNAAIQEFVKRHGSSAALKAEKKPELLFEMTTNANEFSSFIISSWRQRISAREPVRLMEAAGVVPVAIKASIQIHRDETMDVIMRNPYELAAIPKVGFVEADKVGRFQKIGAGDPRRVTAAVRGAVGNKNNDGSTCFSIVDIVDNMEAQDIDVTSILSAISTDSGLVMQKTPSGLIAQTTSIFAAEQLISTKVRDMLITGRKSPKDEIDRVAQDVLSQEKYARFDEIQKQAVITSARENFAILTGGPGTGKSTVTEAIAEIAYLTAKGPVILGAPTGKAACRLEETTGKSASTLHRLLGAQGTGASVAFKFNEDNQLPAGCVVIIDEASMLDAELASALMKALPADGRLLLVGDKHQLPSVGAGYVFGDLIGSRSKTGVEVPSSELINVYRSDKNSDISIRAAEIRKGTFDAGCLSNVVRGGLVMFDLEGKAIVDKIVGLFSDTNLERLGVKSMADIAVLCPQRTGTAGTYQLNAALSRKLNPRGASIPGLDYRPDDDKREPLPRVGDRVMMTRNDYENDIMNGDVGDIIGVEIEKDEYGKQKTSVKVKFDANKTVNIPVAKCRDLILAYAITGHKSQGSQYRCVVMPFSRDHSAMLDRTLVYTEWTRAKNYLILVGEREVMSASLDKVSAGSRKTMLKQYMSEQLEFVPRVGGATHVVKSPTMFGSPANANKPINKQTIGLNPFGKPKTNTNPLPDDSFKTINTAENRSGAINDNVIQPPASLGVGFFGRPKVIVTEPDEEVVGPRP